MHQSPPAGSPDTRPHAQSPASGARGALHQARDTQRTAHGGDKGLHGARELYAWGCRQRTARPCRDPTDIHARPLPHRPADKQTAIKTGILTDPSLVPRRVTLSVLTNTQITMGGGKKRGAKRGNQSSQTRSMRVRARAHTHRQREELMEPGYSQSTCGPLPATDPGATYPQIPALPPVEQLVNSPNFSRHEQVLLP